MSVAQHDLLTPPKWNKAAKLRHDKIAKRLAESGASAKEVNLETIRARRARLEALTKNMRTPRGDKRSSSRLGPSIPSGGHVRLQPLEARSPNELDKKRQDDSLLKRPKSTHQHTPLSTKPASASSRKSSYDDQEREEKEKRYGVEEDEEQERGEKEEYGREAEHHRDYDQGAEENDGDTEDDVRRSSNESGQSTDLSYENAPLETVTEQNVKEILRQLRARTEEERLIAAYKARKHLSIEKDPPFDMYIELGVIPLLVPLLSSYNPNIQFEAAWALTNISSGSSDHAMAVYEGGAVPEMIALLSSPYGRVSDQCVWAVGNLTGDSYFLWQVVVDEGAIKPLFTLIQKSPSLSSLRNLSWTFSNILRHKPLSLSVSDFGLCLKAVRQFLHHPDKEIHLNACWSLVYITDNGNDKIGEVLRAGVLPRVVEELLDSKDKKTITPALRTVGNIMTGTDEQTHIVVQSGVIPLLVRHLDHSSSSIRKDCAWALSNIMAGTEEQIQEVIDAEALPQLALAIDKDELRVMKECVWCVSNLTQSGSESQVDAAIGSGLLASLVHAAAKRDTRDDKQLLNVTLQGVENMLQKCSDPSAASALILKELPLAEIEKFTYDDDKSVSAVAAQLHLTLSDAGKEKSQPE